MSPMKVQACASGRQRDDHILAEAEIVHRKLDADGNIVVTVQSHPSTLSRDVAYHLFLSFSPEELDAMYRFSMTTKPI